MGMTNDGLSYWQAESEEIELLGACREHSPLSALAAHSIPSWPLIP